MFDTTFSHFLFAAGNFKEPAKRGKKSRALILSKVRGRKPRAPMVPPEMVSVLKYWFVDELSKAMLGTVQGPLSRNRRTIVTITKQIPFELFEAMMARLQEADTKDDSCRMGASNRYQVLGQKGVTLWLTGLSGAGKTTITKALEKRLLLGLRKNIYNIDGDNLRTGLTRDLGFSAEDRAESVRRASSVAQLFSEAGVISVVTLISPYRKDRDAGAPPPDPHPGGLLIFLSRRRR